ncbi:hypothetical protein IC232_26245 [Microvirga sp. BT688]|uniref:hypothetical protein n=1 Tax=Microvirga sp. TaxID=1873136 RepID=UPI00168853E8|nr:hypothetical protein [Microvirga sp.]MBD2750171.1 hypothetical protein [Microvirga sp.]
MEERRDVGAVAGGQGVQGNLLAYLVLFTWPLIIFAVYSRRARSHSVARTTAWLMMLSVMFLPSSLAYDPPLLPALDKHRVSFLAIALAVITFHRGDLLKAAPKHMLPRIIFLVLLVGVVRTVQTNGDPLLLSRISLPGLTSHDILSSAIALALDVYLPFAIGQRVFRTEQDLYDLFEVMSTCMLIYAPLMLLEVRLSPQLHRWVYGFHPHDFIQAMREDGYRPVVFMNHGLSVAMWVFSGLCATLALQKAGRTLRITVKQRLMAGVVLMVLTKSWAPTIYAVIASFLIWLMKPKAVVRVVALVSIVVLAYPVARFENLIPAERVVEFVRQYNPDRAQSLEFRFDNESILLARAMERPLHGWGTFGRNLIYSESDGRIISVTDGYWIIMIGAWGYLGFFCFFALMVLPLWRFAWHCRRMSRSEQAAASCLALILALFTFDLLPNSRSDYLSVVYAGILWTVSERFSRRARLSRADRIDQKMAYIDRKRPMARLARSQSRSAVNS